jgi:hypothetical protein
MIPNPQFRCSIIAFLLTLSSAVSKGEEKNDPFSNAPPVVTEDDRRRPPPPPDHLAPPTPNTEDYSISYRKLLTSNLKLDSRYLALMLVTPSFEGEYSLLLEGDGNSASIKESKTFSLTLTKSVESIWYSMPGNNQEEKQKEIKLKTSTASISPALAARVLDLWNQMIARAREPENPNTGLDGVTIEFATASGRGEVWSPSRRNSPLLLAELGETLVQYCQAPEKDREEMLKEINTAADALETYLKEHPQEEKSKTGEEK